MALLSVSIKSELDVEIVILYTKPDRQQIVISKENLEENELCVMVTEEDLLLLIDKFSGLSSAG